MQSYLSIPSPSPLPFLEGQGFCGRKGIENNYLLSPALLKRREGRGLVPQPLRRKMACEQSPSVLTGPTSHQGLSGEPGFLEPEER